MNRVMDAARTRTLDGRFVVLCACLCFGVAGCGGKSLETVPVSGKVTLDGKPLANALVSFNPEGTTASERPFLAVGTTDADGSYQLSTENKTGAPLGRYKVTVSLPRPKPGESPTASVAPDVLTKYGVPANTPFAVEVVASPAAGAYDLALKSQ